VAGSPRGIQLIVGVGMECGVGMRTKHASRPVPPSRSPEWYSGWAGRHEPAGVFREQPTRGLHRYLALTWMWSNHM